MAAGRGTLPRSGGRDTAAAARGTARSTYAATYIEYVLIVDLIDMLESWPIIANCNCASRTPAHVHTLRPVVQQPVLATTSFLSHSKNASLYVMNGTAVT